MARFIEEFYYGNIDPQARSTRQNKTVQKEMAVLTKTEEQLTSALEDEQKKWITDPYSIFRLKLPSSCDAR